MKTDRELSSVERPLLKLHWFHLVAVVLLLGACFYKHLGMTANPRSGEDYYHFWIIPKIANLDSTLDWYDRSQHALVKEAAKSITSEMPSRRIRAWQEQCELHYATGLHPTGTPWFYAFLGWFHTSNVELDCQLFQSVSSLLFLLGCVGIGCYCGASIVRSSVLAAVFFIAHRAVDADIGVSNVNRLQAGLVSILLIGMFPRSRYKDFEFVFFVGSMALGTFLAFKPNILFVPVFLIIAFVLDGHFRKAVSHAAGLLAGGILAWYFGWAKSLNPGIWWRWKEYTESIWNEPFSVVDGNYAFILVTGVVGQELKVLSQLVCILIVGIGAYWIYRTRTRTDVPIRYLCVGLLGLFPFLIAAPVTWGHYIVLTIPLSIVLMLEFLSSPRQLQYGNQVLIGLGVMLSGIVPLAWIPNLPPIYLLVSIQVGIFALYMAGCRSLASIVYLRRQ